MKKVVKFGGSSLASAEQFRKVAGIIHADEDRAYVVPSAPGKRFAGDEKVTDMLLKTAALLPSDPDAAKEKLEQIHARYREIIDGLSLSLSLDGEFETIFTTAKGLCAEADNEKREQYLASRGEYLNGIVLAAYLGFTFVDAAQVVRFREDGTFDADRTHERMRPRLKETDKAVIPGFYGATEDGTIVTFSRGGSDITGSIVARAIHADVYENWTDVSGFMVADPRIIKNPARIETITYLELRELAYMGASVLHEDAIFPVRKRGIPINIRNTNDPEDEGTWIVESTAKKSRYTITGIAGRKDFCCINIEKDMMNSEVGFIRRVLQAFEDQNISVEHVPSGIDTMTVFVEQDMFIDKEQSVVSEIHRLAKPDLLEIESDMALIAVVGRGMKSTRGTAGRIFSALAHAAVNVRMIDQGSSELNIIIGVEARDFEKAIRAIYDIFVTTQL